MKKIILFFFLISLSAWAQDATFDDGEADFELGGDIFNDYSEGIESTRIQERENFFNYSNFFSVDFNIGWTTFDGNRGQAFEENSSPGFGLGVNYYFESNVTFGTGFNYTQNYFTIDEPVLFAIKSDDDSRLISFSMPLTVDEPVLVTIKSDESWLISCSVLETIFEPNFTAVHFFGVCVIVWVSFPDAI